MANVQLYLAYVIPTFLVLLGVLMNRSDNAAFRQEFRQEFNSLRQEMIALRDSIHRDIIGLYERIAVVEANQAAQSGR